LFLRAQAPEISKQRLRIWNAELKFSNVGLVVSGVKNAFSTIILGKCGVFFEKKFGRYEILRIFAPLFAKATLRK